MASNLCSTSIVVGYSKPIKIPLSKLIDSSSPCLHSIFTLSMHKLQVLINLLMLQAMEIFNGAFPR